jgi:predicted metal-binding membrane protein
VIEAVLRRERAVTLAGLAALVGLSWLALLRIGGHMADMAAMGMAHRMPWTAADAVLMTTMWTVMMVAMMLPTATPMILVFASVNRRRRAAGQAPGASTMAFVLGYLGVWIAFAVAATAAQWALHAAALLSPDAMQAAPLVGAAVLVAAGVYQLTPLKHACLSRCQTPLGFLLSEWREGRRGALVMGMRHGAFCLGCCWLLMALLFAGGVMNLAWVGGLTVFVLLEKVLPAGRVVSWLAGAALIAWGLWTLSASS